MRTSVASLAACLFVATALLGCSSTNGKPTEDADQLAAVASTEDRELALRTMKSMRTMAVACEAYAIDWGHYPTAESALELELIVTPVYARSIDVEDGWGNPFEVSSSKKGYEIRSYGRDGTRDRRKFSGMTNDLDADIVFSDTRLTQAPFSDL